MPSTPRQSNRPPNDTGSGSDRASSVPDHLKVLGDFELRREIGRGGMGTVYEARQRSLKRIVALKVLSAQASASATVVERFLREAQAAAKLHHTYIVPVFAQGEEQGVYFYAMELVEGHSLHAIITSARRRQVADTATVDINETVVLPRSNDARKTSTKPRSGSAQSPGENDSTVSLPDPLGTCSTAQRCAAIAAHIADVADGLDYAHRHGVIHRDIKPHNLMLGDDGRLRIADFGLARLSEQAGVTMTGEMLGSPMYMAPEQILEGPGQIDARVDLYALGVTLYEWLALRPPFPGETRERVLRLILSADAPALRSLNPDIPSAIETICAKAMSRDRRGRYQTAGAFRDDLRRFLADEPIVARQAGVFARTRRFFQRHQVGSLAALAGVFAVALGWSLMNSKTPVGREATGAQSTQTEPTGDQNGTTGSTRPTVNSDQLLSMLRKAWPAEFGALSGGAGIAAPVMEDIVRAGQELSVLRDRSPEEVADSFTLGTPMGITQRAAPDLYESMARTDWPPAADDPDDGFAKMLIGANELRRTNPASALQFVDMFVQNRSEDFDARQLRAALSAQMGYYDQFAQDAEALVRLADDRAAAYIWRGLSQLLSRRAEAGLVDFARALELEPDSSWAATLRGLALLHLNQASEAIQTFNQAVDSAPDLILALLGRAAAFAATGSTLDAVSDLTRVLQLRPNDADALTMRGDYNAVLGRYADASKDFENAIEVAGDTPALFFRLMIARSQHNTQLGQPPEKVLAPVSPRTPDADATRPEASNGTSSRVPIECVNPLTLRQQRSKRGEPWHGKWTRPLAFTARCLRWP